MNKKKILIIGSILIVTVIIVAIICMSKKNKTYKDWDSFVKTYKDQEISLKKEKTNYTNKITLKDKKIVIDGKTIMTNIIKVYVVDYNNDNYVYLETLDGKTYYMNNINMSTMDEYELTEIGDYKKMISIEVKENKVIGKDIDNKTYNMSKNMKNYIEYSKQ